MRSLTFCELAERMRIRAAAAAEILESADESADLSLPPALGRAFWQGVYRETTIVAALLSGAPRGDVWRYAERASLLLGRAESAAMDPLERAAMQVVRHELAADLAMCRRSLRGDAADTPASYCA